MAPLIQCVPNFSEGRRTEVIEAIVTAIGETPGIRLADWSADTDHNRMVVTFLGEPPAVCAASLAACRAAIRHINLTMHGGVHPRLGALDVLPLVPLRDVSLAECSRLALELGRQIAAEHDLPVFLYEAASESQISLPKVRKNAFQSILPDFGPDRPHPTAGAVVVGARLPLLAFNVDLQSNALDAAQVIARELRQNGGAGFVGIRALGLSLPSRHQSQVSLNITQPHAVSLVELMAYIARRAQEMGTEVIGSELIGAMPGFTAFGVLRDALQASNLKPGQVLLENWGDTESLDHP